MKRVLLCAFYFMPRNHVASYRTGCMAKYLPENGWQPTVLCQDWPEGSRDFDPDLVGAFPKNIRICRIPQVPERGFYQRTILRKLFPYLWPHRAPILWWRQARAQLEQLRQQERFDAVWATSDPLVTLGLAQEFVQRARLPWVADIRDSFNVQQFGSWYKRPVFAFHERRLCRQATRIVAVSKGLANGLGDRIGRQVEIIHNGFDPELFQDSPRSQSPVFRLVFAGNLVWPKQDPTPLFQALTLCLRSGRIATADLELSFFGTNPETLRKAYPLPVQGLTVRIQPRIPHIEMAHELQAGTILLLFTHTTERGVLTGKVFDYLAAGRPILAVPDDQGDVTTLLRRTGAGVTLSTPETIADQLVAWYREWKTGHSPTSRRQETEIARYSRREQAKQLAQILNEISAV